MASKRTVNKRANSRVARRRQRTPQRGVPTANSKSANKRQTARAVKDSTCPIVGIGGSAGGYEAASELLKYLPPKSGMAFVIVQHLDPHHASNLPKLLGKVTQLPVMEIIGQNKPEPDTVYVLPPNKDLVYKNGTLRLTQRSERPMLAIDHFFESIADEQGRRAIGVLLSGTGSDGTAGLRAIKAAGGITFAQDEESAKFSAMPRNAIVSGFVDAALSPKEIATQLLRIAEHPYIKKPQLDGAEVEPPREQDLDDLSRIFLALKKHTGVDFTAYKQSTLQRRIDR